MTIQLKKRARRNGHHPAASIGRFALANACAVAVPVGRGVQRSRSATTIDSRQQQQQQAVVCVAAAEEEEEEQYGSSPTELGLQKAAI
jgi:hypothetical protein